MTEAHSEPTQAVTPGADPEADHPSDPAVVKPSEAVAREFGEPTDPTEPAEQPSATEPPDA